MKAVVGLLPQLMPVFGQEQMETLISILRRALNSCLEEGWLYLPKAREWRPNTKGAILDVDGMTDAEVDDEDYPMFAKERGLVATIDSQTIEDVVWSARQLESPPSEDLLIEAFTYYVKFDAFLPERGFEPPSEEEITARLDREFYDSLGDESDSEKCRHPECERGRIPLSIRCKVHHFESIQKKPCLFND